MLQRKINAIAGEHPENHALRLFSSAEPSAFLRPEGRKPYRLAFPLQMTLRLRVYLFNIGKSCLHLCLALLPLDINVAIMKPELNRVPSVQPPPKKKALCDKHSVLDLFQQKTFSPSWTDILEAALFDL